MSKEMHCFTNLLAAEVQQKSNDVDFIDTINSSPQSWEAVALPTELLPHLLSNYIYLLNISNKIKSVSICHNWQEYAAKSSILNILLAAKVQQNLAVLYVHLVGLRSAGSPSESLNSNSNRNQKQGRFGWQSFNHNLLNFSPVRGDMFRAPLNQYIAGNTGKWRGSGI